MIQTPPLSPSIYKSTLAESRGFPTTAKVDCRVGPEYAVVARGTFSLGAYQGHAVFVFWGGGGEG